jgi:hypothetical protein
MVLLMECTFLTLKDSLKLTTMNLEGDGALHGEATGGPTRERHGSLTGGVF